MTRLHSAMIAAATALPLALAATGASALSPHEVSVASAVHKIVVIGGGRTHQVGPSSLFHRYRCNKVVNGEGYYATGVSPSMAERRLERAGLQPPFICTTRF